MSHLSACSRGWSMVSNSEMASAMNQQRLALLKVELVAIDKWTKPIAETRPTTQVMSFLIRCGSLGGGRS